MNTHIIRVSILDNHQSVIDGYYVYRLNEVLGIRPFCT